MILSLAVAFSLMIEAAKMGRFEPLTEKEMPVIVQLSPKELGNKVCGEDWDPKKHCDKFLALYFPNKNELFYSKEIDLGTDFGQSVIFHELIHALQAKKNNKRELLTCIEVLDSEKEAYLLQDIFMTAHGHYDTNLRNIVQFLKCPATKEI